MNNVIIPTFNNNVSKPGDWFCDDCGINNFARREICCKCKRQRAKKARTAPQSSASFRPGDWVCARCDDLQFKANKVCRKCNTSRPLKADDADTDACAICFDAVRNAALAHGDSLHIVACLTCSKQLLRRDGKCPVCREMVQKVYTVFT